MAAVTALLAGRASLSRGSAPAADGLLGGRPQEPADRGVRSDKAPGAASRSSDPFGPAVLLRGLIAGAEDKTDTALLSPQMQTLADRVLGTDENGDRPETEADRLEQAMREERGHRGLRTLDEVDEALGTLLDTLQLSVLSGRAAAGLAKTAGGMVDQATRAAADARDMIVHSDQDPAEIHKQLNRLRLTVQRIAAKARTIQIAAERAADRAEQAKEREARDTTPPDDTEEDRRQAAAAAQDLERRITALEEALRDGPPAPDLTAPAASPPEDTAPAPTATLAVTRTTTVATLTVSINQVV